VEFDLLLRKRRNVYGFQDKEVPDAILHKILENARHVPSAGFTQDFDLVVIRDPETKRKLAEAGREQEYAGYAGIVRGSLNTLPSSWSRAVTSPDSNPNMEVRRRRPQEFHGG